MFTVETVVSQTELSYEENMVIYGIDDNTFDIKRLFPLSDTVYYSLFSTENRIILYSECPNPIYSSFILFF